MTRLLFALLLALLSVPIACAQPGADEQLAAQYFQQGDFEKAAMYYERLHSPPACWPIRPWFIDSRSKTFCCAGVSAA